jgi:hypothetical protein
MITGCGPKFGAPAGAWSGRARIAIALQPRPVVEALADDM